MIIDLKGNVLTQEDVGLVAQSIVEDVAIEALAVLHGKASIDYVLGYQRCVADMMAAIARRNGSK